MFIQHFERNTLGQDFVAGDLHGHFHLLEMEMKRVGFNTATDRLFATGDLVNKGQFSGQVLRYLDYPWFFSVMGNHELVVVENCIGQCSDAELAKSGGMWYVNLPRLNKEKIAEQLQKLPLGIEVETNFGLIGLVHAEVMRDDWYYFVQCAREIQNQRDFTRVAATALWERQRIRNHSRVVVQGVTHAYVGHAPQPQILTLGNVSYIDSGLYKGGSLNLIPISHFTQFGV